MSFLLAQFGGLSTLIYNMQSMGFFQFLFPFLLVLAVVYGVLIYALPREFPKSAKGLISLIIAFFVMLYAASTFNIAQVLAQMFGSTVLMVGSGILILVIILGILGITPSNLWKKQKEGEQVTGAGWVIVLLVVIVGILVVFGTGIESVIGIPGWIGSSDLWTIIFFLVILAVVFYFLKSEKEPAATK
jgi:hypothetical protein